MIPHRILIRDRVQYSTKIKEQIAVFRKQGKEALLNVEKNLGDIKSWESGVVIA
jgi:hypothetical protein